MELDSAKKTKIVKIAVSCALALCLAGSFLAAIFSGGEILQAAQPDKVKGLMRMVEADYSTSYLTGDKFEFDKENSKIMLLAKDPALEDIVRVERLPASEYGFMVNGKGKMIYNPSEITMDASVKTVDVVSRVYPDVRATIDVSVLGSIDEEQLVNGFVYEAEHANVYKDDVLLTEEQLENSAVDGKSFLSDRGIDPIKQEFADKLSGGICLRNFQTTNMKAEFEIICSEETEIDLEVWICMRKQAGTFGSWYTTKLNGKELTVLNDVEVPADPAGQYFNSHHMAPVKITLKRGLNVLTFESGNGINKPNPANLDAIKLTCEKSVLGTMAAVIPVQSEEEQK